MMAAQVPKMPSIPVPIKGDDQSTHETIMAMKQTLELMMGTRGSTPLARVFVQEDVPVPYSVGDLWVQPSTKRISCWTSIEWLLTVGV